MILSSLVRNAVLSTVGLFMTMSGNAQTLKFDLPIKPDLTQHIGYVQKLVDIDESPLARDHRCLPSIEDGHSGTDFRLRNIAETDKHIEVLAAADGTVVAVRDGMPDALIRNKAQADRVRDRGCGNAVVLKHVEGFSSNYCHLKKGSVKVTKGQEVSRGQALGFIGYSGLAGFAHVHFGIKHRGKYVDPFIGIDGQDMPCIADTVNLWTSKANRQLKRLVGSKLLSTHFSDRVIEHGEFERTGQFPRPTQHSEIFLFHVRFANLQQGDVINIALHGPNDLEIKPKPTVLDNYQSSYSFRLGKRANGQPWPVGEYTAEFQVSRLGETIISGSRTFIMQP